MFRLRFCFSVLMAVLIFASSTNAQEKIELRLRLEKGQTYDQVVATEQTIRQSSEPETTVKNRFGLHSEVLDVNENGLISIKTTYVYTAMSAAIKGKTMVSYDSRQPPKVLPDMVGITHSMVGQSITTMVSDRGKVIKMDGLDNIVERMMKNKLIPENQRAEFLSRLKKNFKEQSQQKSNFLRFPENALAVGDSWIRQNTQTLYISLLAATKYTLFSRKDGIAVLAFQSTIKETAKPEPIKISDLSVEISLEGAQNGVLSLDETTGLIREMQVHQNISGTISRRENKNGLDATTIIPLKIKSTTRLWTTMPSRKPAP